MLTKIKLLLGLTDSSKDSLLNALISIATTKVIEYTHQSDWTSEGLPDELEDIIVCWVVYMYRSGEGDGSMWQLGGEGIKAESYSGVSFTYMTASEIASSNNSSTYFETHVAPLLKGRRRIQVIGTN